MPKMLRLSADLSMPLDAVTQSFAILARKGAGKTYTARKFVEELVRAGQPVVVLDPTGAYWGLKSSADGERPGLPVIVFGGDHADVPIDRRDGKEIASVVLEHPGAYVLDFSAFDSRAAEMDFSADFLERLYRGKKRETGPLMLVIDEADTFAPQQPRDKGNQLRTLGATEAIVRRGRIKGLGVMLITQRAAVLNKNVLTQTEVLICLQTTGPQDIAAVKEWVLGHATKERAEIFAKSLPSLGKGEAWVWSPSWLRKLVQITVGATTTFDSSATPEPGAIAVAPRAFAKVDLDKLGARIAATREELKANDPRELKARIAQLERELRARPSEVVEKIVEKVVEKPVLDDEDRDMLLTALNEAREASVALDRAADRIAEKLRPEIVVVERQRKPREVTTPLAGRLEREPAKGVVHDYSAIDVKLSPTDRGVLSVLAQFDTRTQQQVAILSGYSPTSGGFMGSLAKLRRESMIEGSASSLWITQRGRDAVGEVDPLPQGADLVNFWLNKLPTAEGKVLKVLVDHLPAEVEQMELAEKVGYSPTSGGFMGALAKLRKLDLISGSRSGLRASEDLLG